MKRALGLLAAALSAWTLSSATASADSEAVYLADLQANGFTNKNGAAAQVAQGRGICAQLGEGTEPLRIAQNVQSQIGVDFRTAYVFVDIAATDLCPEYGKGIGMHRSP